MNKMLTSLSTIIERWNETCLNQESSGQVRFKKILVLYFCKILLKIILIRIVFRSAMATTSVRAARRNISIGILLDLTIHKKGARSRSVSECRIAS